jgi:predicted thioesterase
MKPSLAPGVSVVNRFVVDKAKTIGFMGEEGRVYATPCLIGDIEMTCRNLILAHADANEDSVGMEVAVQHLAPTLPGMTVEITVSVTAVEGRRVDFAVAARDDLDTFWLPRALRGRQGQHRRAPADQSRKLAARAAS